MFLALLRDKNPSGVLCLSSYQLTGPTPAALPPEQQADYNYVDKRIRSLRIDLAKWEQLASVVNKRVY